MFIGSETNIGEVIKKITLKHDLIASFNSKKSITQLLIALKNSDHTEKRFSNIIIKFDRWRTMINYFIEIRFKVNLNYVFNKKKITCLRLTL